MTNKTKAILYVLLCVLLWALIPVVSKLGQNHLDHHQFLFWSSLVSCLTFAIINLVQQSFKIYRQLSKRNWLQAISLGLLGTYLYYLLLYFGYARAQGIEVLVIQYCWPIFVILLSVVLLKEHLNERKLLSVVLGFIGVLLVLSKGDFTHLHFSNLLVDGIVLLAAFVFGLFSVLSKKVSTNALPLTSIYFLTATVASFLSMLLFSGFKLPDAASTVPVLINGIFVNGISYIFWIKALKYGKASFVAPFVFITPALSTLLLVLFINETFLWVYMIGMVLVIGGGLVNKE